MRLFFFFGSQQKGVKNHIYTIYTSDYQHVKK